MTPLVRACIWIAVFALGVVPSVAFADRWASDSSGQVWAQTSDLTYLRAEPDLMSERVATLRSGSLLRVVAEQGDWTQIYEPRTRTSAYVHRDLLTPAETPSAYVYMTPPPIDQELETVAIATEDVPLYFYPDSNARAQAFPIEASTRENIVGVVIGSDGTSWYETEDGYFLPPNGLFMANEPNEFGGRWLDVSLSGSAKVVAYENGAPVRSFFAIKGVPKFPTPIGAWSIVRRVQNETMDSTTIGIPRNSPGGYYLKDVLYTQYFRDTGESLHYNWWSSAWGTSGSHGCLGLSLGDSKWLWEWATVGTPVNIHR